MKNVKTQTPIPFYHIVLRILIIVFIKVLLSFVVVSSEEVVVCCMEIDEPAALRPPADSWASQIRSEFPYFWDDSNLISVCTDLITTSLICTKSLEKKGGKKPQLRNIIHACSCLPYTGPERFAREIVPRARRLRAEMVLSLSLCQRHERRDLEIEVDRFLNSRLVLVDWSRILQEDIDTGYTAFHGDALQSYVRSDFRFYILQNISSLC